MKKWKKNKVKQCIFSEKQHEKCKTIIKWKIVWKSKSLKGIKKKNLKKWKKLNMKNEKRNENFKNV